MYLQNDKSKNLRYTIFGFIMFLIIFENALENSVSILGKMDEALTVIIVLMSLASIIKFKPQIKDALSSKRILISLSFLILVGIVGNLLYRYQYTKFAIKDILTFRGILCYALIPIIAYDFNIEYYKYVIKESLKLVTIVLFALVVCNFILDIFPYYEVRFGIKSQQLFFTHPTYLVTSASIILALISSYLGKDKKMYIYVAMISLVILSTLRTKAIMFLMAYIYLLFVVDLRKRKLAALDLIVVGIVVVGIGFGEVRDYLQNPDWARSAMTLNAFDIAKNHFPFGSGFGTFGTWVSGVNYSPLYFTYDMQTIWGLAPDYHNFVADTFWPMILAQFGFVGLIIMGYILINIYLDINNNNNIYNYLGQMTILVYLITSSIGESSFTGPQSVILFLIIGMLRSYRRVK